MAVLTYSTRTVRCGGLPTSSCAVKPEGVSDGAVSFGRGDGETAKENSTAMFVAQSGEGVSAQQFSKGVDY